MFCGGRDLHDRYVAILKHALPFPLQKKSLCNRDFLSQFVQKFSAYYHLYLFLPTVIVQHKKTLMFERKRL